MSLQQALLNKHYPDSLIARLLRLQLNRLIKVWITPAQYEVALENSGASKNWQSGTRIWLRGPFVMNITEFR